MKMCRRCSHRLTTKNVTPGYKYYCPNCDEDMFGIEAVDVPVVVVKDLGDGRVATRKHFRVRRVDHRWRIECTYWNPVSGEWNSFVHVAFLWRVRSKAYAERVCRSHFRPAWNWWYETPERVREKARESGIIVRIVKEKHGKQGD